MASRYVLDTSILSALLKQEAVVLHQMSQALLMGSTFLLCPIVYFELSRGLLYRDAHRQRGAFVRLTRGMETEPLDNRDWDTAAQLWATLRKAGHNIADADLLIGTYALVRGAIIVTDNEKDFAPLGIAIENWRR